MNLISSVAITFLIPQVSGLFTFTNMSMDSMGIIFVISMIAIILTVAYSEIINWLKLYINLESHGVSRKEEREMIERM